jgi:hypothetical protein
VFETRLVVGTLRGNGQQVGSCRCKDPLAVSADLNREDWVTKAWQQGLRILANLFVQSDLTVAASDRKATSQRGADSAESRVCLVGSLNRNSAARAQTRVNSEDVALANSVEELSCSVLRIFELVCNAFNPIASLFSCVILFNHLASFKIKVD